MFRKYAYDYAGERRGPGCTHQPTHPSPSRWPPTPSLPCARAAVSAAGAEAVGLLPHAHHPPRKITVLLRKTKSGRNFENMDEVMRVINATGERTHTHTPSVRPSV